MADCYARPWSASPRARPARATRKRSTRQPRLARPDRCDKTRQDRCDKAGAKRSAAERSPAFVCTGFGAEERGDPRWQAFPVKLIFATAGGAYYADVDGTISDTSGAEMRRVHCDAPWLLAALQPGTYRVTARAATGEARQARVTVRTDRQASLVTRFPGITE